MPNPKVENTLRVSQRELDALLAEASKPSAPSSGSTRRRSRRWSFAGPKAVLTMIDRLGERRHYVAASRNLSTTGIAVVFGMFIHPGTRCLISLRTRSGNPSTHAATVRHSRLMRGRLHDLGIEFDTPINPLDFVKPGAEGQFNVERVEPSQLTGRVLFVEDCRTTQRLYAHFLGDTKLDLLFAERCSTAMEFLDDDPDFIFVDYHLPDRTGIELIKQLRGDHFMGPVVMLTADPSPSLRHAVLREGGNELLSKPVSKDLLQQAVAEHLLGEANRFNEHRRIYSTVESAVVPHEYVSNFVEELRRMAGSLERAIEGEDVLSARENLIMIRGSAGGYGFAPISDFAAEAMTRLDSTMSIEESMVELQRVINASHRATVIEPSGYAADVGGGEAAADGEAGDGGEEAAAGGAEPPGAGSGPSGGSGEDRAAA